jgi:hypothetical protein
VAHETQDGIAAGIEMKLFADACASLPPESKSEHPQRLLEPDRPLGMGKRQQRKSLRKDFASTGLFWTKEATDFHKQMNGSVAAGKVV